MAVTGQLAGVGSLSHMGVPGVELRVSGLAEDFTQSPLGPYFVIFI